MKIPNNNYNDFLIPLYRGSRVAAYTTWRGEISDSGNPYNGFSLCHYTGDDPAHVESCRMIMAECLGVEPSEIVVPRQIHGTKCLIYRRKFTGTSELEGVDALVTDERNLAIGVNTADCMPIVIIDDCRGIAGVAHAGWRGAVGGVVLSALDAMLRCGSSVDDLEVVMGPCICESCFEVGIEVAEQFPSRNVVVRSKPHVDLAGYIRDKLVDLGIGVERIKLPQSCTRCFPEKYFSARASGIASGRNFTFAIIRK